MFYSSEFLQVHLIGFPGEKCIDEVEFNSNITRYNLSTGYFNKLPRFLFLLYAPLKVLWQFLQLIIILLFTIPKPNAILVQNPPSIPTMAIAYFASRIRGSKFYVDWHNFGYTILQLSLRKNHPLIWISRMYEQFFGNLADGNLCVTNSMKTWLKKSWNIDARVLYDKAPPFFKKTSVEVEHSLMLRLLKEGALPLSTKRVQVSSDPRESIEETLFTSAPLAPKSTSNASGKKRDHSLGKSPRRNLTPLLSTPGSSTPTLRRNRPALLISSTSWTEDEDFGLLLDALVVVDAAVKESPSEYPDFVVVVTGKGPQKSMYEAKIAALKLEYVVIRTMWLSYSDYPILLGSADLGVCLHTSSSGLDLPMKVVDMFGAGLPVCAVDFSCLHELVQHNVNGLVFSTSKQLAQQILDLFRRFPTSSSKLANLRTGVEKFQRVRWQDNWDESARDLFTQ
jgi:beta-1,4-mannosyltransferase